MYEIQMYDVMQYMYEPFYGSLQFLNKMDYPKTMLQ